MSKAPYEKVKWWCYEQLNKCLTCWCGSMITGLITGGGGWNWPIKRTMHAPEPWTALWKYRPIKYRAGEELLIVGGSYFEQCTYEQLQLLRAKNIFSFLVEDWKLWVRLCIRQNLKNFKWKIIKHQFWRAQSENACFNNLRINVSGIFAKQTVLHKIPPTQHQQVQVLSEAQSCRYSYKRTGLANSHHGAINSTEFEIWPRYKSEVCLSRI